MEDARREADEFFMNMPPELSLDMQVKLAAAREFLKNKEVEQNPEIQAHIDKDFHDLLTEYKDEDIGCIQNEKSEDFVDEIDEDEFNDILQEFINENAYRCKHMLEKYKDDKFEGRVRIGSTDNILDTTADIKDAMFKLLKLKNGEIVRLISREQMRNIKDKENQEEYEKSRDHVKSIILKFNDEWLEKIESGIADQEIPERMVIGEGDEETWDVESILSTRTNTDNHPGVIKSIVKVKQNPIKLDPKTRAPELEDEHKPVDNSKQKSGPYIEAEISDDSDEDIETDTKEIPDLEKMNDKERKKYLRKLNKKQVKKEKKERRVMKKQMKKEFAKQNQQYAKSHTVGIGEIRPGTSVRHL